MQRASYIFGGLVSAPKGKAKPGAAEPLLDPEQIACAAWPRAVGKRIANYSRAVKLVRGRLVVEVDDVAWQRNLFTLSRHIIGNVERSVGPNVVRDIEFRVMPRRREPQRATAVSPSPMPDADESNAIADPGLRRLYRAARLKELA